ncbi:hypothetical protein [Flavobacterium sp. N502540]|uniref:hypothetical protein n=1 Tax=Flavobacterium sp. N502540 TaxID=2986838 RepID=UPI0022247351|nr:hypothetical protein [Flavobacterium sp. N502540]
MTKKITIILLLIFMPFIILFVTNKVSIMYYKMRYDATYKNYQEGIAAKNYVLVPVSTVILQDVVSGNINFDTINHKFILPLKHQYYDEQKDEAAISNCTYIFDRSGALLSKTESAEENEQQKQFEHCIKLEEILLYNNKMVDVRYFSKERYCYNWNPFRGYGSPTGSGRNITWEGTAYIDLRMKTEILKLKIEEVFAQNFFSNKYEKWDYELNMSVYQLPVKFQKIADVAFFVRHKSYGPNELYIIKTR